MDSVFLGSTLVHQVMGTMSVKDKNKYLCNGIYIAKCGKCENCNHARRAASRRHNRASKRVTQQKNMAREELRTAGQEGMEEG